MVLEGDNREQLSKLSENSVDSVVTDPPYHLVSIVKRFGKKGSAPAKDKDGVFKRSSAGFMGKQWDGLEDGVGIAESPDFWKAVYRVMKPGAHLLAFGGTRTYHRMACAIEDAGFEIRDQLQWLYGSGFPKSHNMKDDWEGWGTALKPANEPIVLARKPLSEKTVAANVLKWGTGALNIDGGRIAHDEPIKTMKAQKDGNKVYGQSGRYEETTELKASGRWPSNVLLDEQAGEILGEEKRFFYCAKPSKAERNEGCENLPKKSGGMRSNTSGQHLTRRDGGDPEPVHNNHPTVKPIKLIQYLVRLITPPKGTVLDPFLGSGTTALAAIAEGFDWIGMERESEYVKIAQSRIEYAERNKEGQLNLLEPE